MEWAGAVAPIDIELSRRTVVGYLRDAEGGRLPPRRLLDILLYWKLDNTPVSTDLALSVATATFRHSDLEVISPLDGQAIAQLTNEVLGWTVSLPICEAGGGDGVDYWSLSRAAAAGQHRRVADAVSLKSAARSACLAMHSCQYLQAARALGVLGTHSPTAPLMQRFIYQCFSHLSALSAAHDSASLAWEVSLARQMFSELPACSS